jgi:beclin 1
MAEREKESFEALMNLEREHDTLKKELVLADDQVKALDLEEQAYWQELNQLEEKLFLYQEELLNVNLEYDMGASQLYTLTKSNSLQDSFQISHEGSFGTINGLRLGRLPNQNVSWVEINAAMGQTALLLDTVSLEIMVDCDQA